jgi:hypothetical protein
MSGVVDPARVLAPAPGAPDFHRPETRTALTALRVLAPGKRQDPSIYAVFTADKASMGKRLVNFRADEDLVRAAQAKAGASGTTLTAVLGKTLQAYAAGRWQPPASPPEVLQGRLAALEALAGME